MAHVGSHFLVTVLSLIFVIAQASAQTAWQLANIQTKAGSLAFTLDRGSTPTNCATTWAGSAYPTAWNQCADTLLRWRFQAYGSASNLSLEIVQVDVIKTSTPPSVNVIRTNITLTSATEPTPLKLTTTTSLFTPSPFDIPYTLTRSDGTADIPCTEAHTFYITDPNVATLGPLTLGRGTETQWQTLCSTTYTCGSTDPSLSSFQPCQAPGFTFKKTLPTTGGNALSDFVLSVKHQFPLMMASSIRGSNAPDYGLIAAEEAGGLTVVLSLADTVWSTGSGTLAPIESGGIDQTGDCETGCEFSGSQVWVGVVDVEII